jgi:hypothetical protein
MANAAMKSRDERWKSRLFAPAFYGGIAGYKPHFTKQSTDADKQISHTRTHTGYSLKAAIIMFAELFACMYMERCNDSTQSKN